MFKLDDFKLILEQLIIWLWITLSPKEKLRFFWRSKTVRIQVAGLTEEGQGIRETIASLPRESNAPRKKAKMERPWARQD